MFYDDDGDEINPEQIPIPELCQSCKKKDDAGEYILCTLNCLDQLDEAEFKCFAYRSLYGELNDDIIS